MALSRRAALWAPLGFAILAIQGRAFADEAPSDGTLAPEAKGEAEAISTPAEDPALALINAYRAAAGAPPARLHPAMLQAA